LKIRLIFDKGVLYQSVLAAFKVILNVGSAPPFSASDFLFVKTLADSVFIGEMMSGKLI
jgi:hypothetical protein